MAGDSACLRHAAALLRKPGRFYCALPRTSLPVAGIGRDAERVFLPAKIPEAYAVALESPVFVQSCGTKSHPDYFSALLCVFYVIIEQFEVHAMNENIAKKNEALAQTVIKGLESRNMTGFYAASKEDALKTALSLIPENSTIAMGGCTSATEIGLIDALKNGKYNYIDRAQMEPRAGLMAAYDADIFLASANAMTSDGEIVNIDGNANRVSCIAQGPKKVVFIVGMNKICADLDSAIKRARNIAAPANAQRFNIDTPCKKTGKCFDSLRVHFVGPYPLYGGNSPVTPPIFLILQTVFLFLIRFFHPKRRLRLLLTHRQAPDCIFCRLRAHFRE